MEAPVLLTYHMATAPCSDKPISYKNKKSTVEDDGSGPNVFTTE